MCLVEDRGSAGVGLCDCSEEEEVEWVVTAVLRLWRCVSVSGGGVPRGCVRGCGARPWGRGGGLEGTAGSQAPREYKIIIVQRRWNRLIRHFQPELP